MDSEFSNKLLEADFPDIVGQDTVKNQIKSALLAGRHIVLVGPPGIGKTTLARNIAKLLPPKELNDCAYHCAPDNPVCPECRAGKHKSEIISGATRFIRVQGSPDLTAEDLLGDIDPIKALQFGPLSIEAFTPGKVFKANNGILFFDEVNRCPEKLQNALLQILEEKKATIASYDVDFTADFLLIGTMNPEDSSTEPLSDVFLDRFDVIYMSYPETMDNELEIVRRSGKKIVKMEDDLLNFAIHYVRTLRESKDLEKHPSVRASIGLYERAQANAKLRGSEIVQYRDVVECIESVISHRIRLAPSVKYLKSAEEFVQEHFEKFSEQQRATEKFSDGP